MLIKICGFTEMEHALLAAAEGADMLGFVFAPSRRRVTPERAREIISGLPPEVRKVGVFVDEDPVMINQIVSFSGLDFVQLHGSESPEDCIQISCPVIKAIRVRDSGFRDEMEQYRDKADMFLLDTYVAGTAGGTGETFDWAMVVQAADFGQILLAGGLTPENVISAICAANPYGVDVSSGVETGGVKDAGKIAAFIRQIRGKMKNVHATG